MSAKVFNSFLRVKYVHEPHKKCSGDIGRHKRPLRKFLILQLIFLVASSINKVFVLELIST